MSAQEKSALEGKMGSDLQTLGIIAGGGLLPLKLIHACERKGITPFIVGFEGQTDTSIFGGRNHMLTRLGAAGHIINTLKSHGIKDLVLIGSISRPSLGELKPDLRAARFFAKMSMRAFGDNDLLSALKCELEREGFQIHGVQDFVHELLAQEGFLGKTRPQKDDLDSIRRGIEASQILGQCDIGQAAVVQEGLILGVEAIEGTDELIRRCGIRYKRKGRGPILVKTCKPHQEENLDLPTIGPDTVRLCVEHGYIGIVVQAEKTLLMEPQEIERLADKHKIFVQAVPLDQYLHPSNDQ